MSLTSMYSVTGNIHQLSAYVWENIMEEITFKLDFKELVDILPVGKERMTLPAEIIYRLFL